MSFLNNWQPSENYASIGITAYLNVRLSNYQNEYRYSDQEKSNNLTYTIFYESNGLSPGEIGFVLAHCEHSIHAYDQWKEYHTYYWLSAQQGWSETC